MSNNVSLMRRTAVANLDPVLGWPQLESLYVAAEAAGLKDVQALSLQWVRG